MPTVFVSFDEVRFPKAVDVDFQRKNIPHAAFGMGIHRCIGSMLARTELRVFVEEWLAQIPEFHIRPGETLVINSGTVSGIRRLPLEWTAR
jgi:cytochrome P450